MPQIDMNSPIIIKTASLRYFGKEERHITRTCPDEVLLLVLEGVLRFTEDGRAFALSAGEYRVQRAGSTQSGPVPSDEPKYMYVHFKADTVREGGLPRDGSFDVETLLPAVRRLDLLSHGEGTLTERSAVFFEILTALYRPAKPRGIADEMAEFLEGLPPEEATLDAICAHFNYSKNHVINLFKKEHGQTPVQYLNAKRLRRAEYLMQVTSTPLSEIATACGFGDYTHFYKLFLRDRGVPPTVWRERERV